MVSPVATSCPGGRPPDLPVTLTRVVATPWGLPADYPNGPHLVNWLPPLPVHALIFRDDNSRDWTACAVC